MIAFLIFLVTLILVIWQPKGLGIGWSACAGALAALALGIVDFGDVSEVWHIVWDATFTFVGLITISSVLDESGFFEVAAQKMASIARGKTYLLFLLIIMLAAAVAAVFANDGAALLLTPIVMALTVRLGLGKGATFAFIMAVGFIADTCSLPLMISNLVNLVSANYFDISFTDYAAVMIGVNIAALLASIVVLSLYFYRSLPGSYEYAGGAAESALVKDRLVFNAALPMLGMLLVAYFVIQPLGVPVSLITSIVALAFLLMASRFWQGGSSASISVKKALKGAPWQIVIFSVGMYLVVYGLGKAFLTEWLAYVLTYLADQGRVAATVGTGFMSAILASVMNNLPSTLMGVLAIDSARPDQISQQLMIYANVVGNDLGPKITPIGSLATLLWLHVLAQKGYAIGWGRYLRTGVVLTLPVLLITLLALAAIV